MSEKEKKFYWLPIFTSCPYSCVYCDAIGACAEQSRTQDDLTRSAEKADIAKYDNLLLPCNVMPLSGEISGDLFDAREICIILNTCYSSDDWNNAIKALEKNSKKVIVIIDDFIFNLAVRLDQVESVSACYEYWIILRKRLDVQRVIDAISPIQQEKVRFYPPINKSENVLFLSPSELYELGKEVKDRHPNIMFIPPTVSEPYQPFISTDLELEPLPSIREITPLTGSVILSIVIPSYNSGEYLKHCVGHLLNQKELTTETYEILIVDDGSTDTSIDSCIQTVLSSYKNIRIKVIRLERARPRIPGDSSFRAGVARNVGSRYAEGKYIAFLDADIIVSPTFVSKLLFSLQSSDIVQVPRYYLTYKSSVLLPQYDDIGEDDCYIPDEGYWHDFYKHGLMDEWNRLDHAYKYVCSYCLAMQTNLFRSHGGFRKTFAFYGFEDTELGYRLYKNNSSLYLLDEIVYHLEPSGARSEYSNNETIRNELLRHSARWFYHLTLDDAVYKHFKFMM